MAIAERTPEQDSTEQPQDREAEAKKRLEKLDGLGQSLAQKRSEAIQARQVSGIEDIWMEDEEYYEGIDELNRGTEGRGTWRQKPPGRVAGRTNATTNSTVFPNITGPFTDAASARIADMLMPNDDRAWAINPTPIPDLIKMKDGIEPAGFAAANVVPMQPEQPPQAVGQPPQAEGQPPEPQLSPEEEKRLALKQAAEEVMQEARRKAKLAEKRIEDWHVDCQFQANVRMVIEDSSRIGCGVLKGPVPFNKRKVAYIDGQIQIVNNIIPRSKWVDPWNFYPDGACGENIHNGSYTWERDNLTVRQLLELADDPNYLPDQIKLCIQEGPYDATSEYKKQPEPGTRSDRDNKGKFEIWYFHGLLTKDDLEAAGCDCSEMDDLERIPAVVTMVNNRVIKAGLNPLDTGDFPYDVMVWRRRAGHWTGIGVARQIRTSQKMVVGATRHLMDNAGIAAGPMLIFKQGSVYPADGKMGLAPRKILYVAEDSEVIDDVRKAIGTIKVDMVIDELLRLIELGMKFAEDTTGLPMMIQGQMGSAPDTVGGMTMLQNNATAVLRRMARTFDDRVTTPHIQRYYTWLLQYSDNDEEKGDFSVQAKASSALVERDIQSQEIAAMGQVVTDLRFGADPKKWFREFLISRHFDPKQFEFDDLEWEKTLQKMSEPPPDPKLQVAEINAQNRSEVAELQAQVKAMLEHGRQQTEQIKLQHETQENAKNRERDIIVQQIESGMMEVLGNMRERGMDRRTVQTLKQKIADTALKLRTQKQLSASEVVKPAAEPKKRAPAGKSFTQ